MRLRLAVASAMIRASIATAMMVVGTATAGDPPAKKPVSPADFDSIEDWPQRPPSKKEASDSGASPAQAATMPWFPWHNLTCNGTLPCRPGEGNTKGYRFWGQPYIHREEYVQSRHRKPPQQPDHKVEYARLCALARHVQMNNLVLVSAADWDFRRIILNWVMHAHKLGYSNALVLSMDAPLHSELRRRGIPSYDNSAHLDAWNATCLQRHIQRVRMERVLCVGALLSAGIDVLHTDATVVFHKDILPFFSALPRDVDFLAQRMEAPPDVIKHTGSGVNPGLLFMRAPASSARREAIVPFILAIIQRGLVEFYHRWDNVVDHFGFTFTFDRNALKSNTSRYANDTTTFRLEGWPKGCIGDGSGPAGAERACFKAGFLPHHLFPRSGSWPEWRDAGALVHHITGGDAALGPQHAEPRGIKPFRGHRQRLDRYDEVDFDDYESIMREMGLWLVDGDPEYKYVLPSHKSRAGVAFDLP